MPRDILKKSNDEKNRLTKRYLRNAMAVLLREIGYNKITITNLTNRAKVSRTAFYKNYSSKDDVLEDILNELFELILRYIGNPFNKDTTVEWYISFFEGFIQNIDRIKILIEAGFHERFSLMINKRIIKKYDSLYDRYRMIGLNGALQMIMREWFENGMKESPREIGELCFKLLNEEE